MRRGGTKLGREGKQEGKQEEGVDPVAIPPVFPQACLSNSPPPPWIHFGMAASMQLVRVRI